MEEKKLYICDGVKCHGTASGCYMEGGDCMHTSDERYSIAKRFKGKFPPTTFERLDDGTLVEKIDLASVLMGIYDNNFEE